ncbi:UNVERIFIED_CONTAM: hypothetical protein K2H54_060186 [Gekko kuhli]
MYNKKFGKMQVGVSTQQALDLGKVKDAVLKEMFTLIQCTLVDLTAEVMLQIASDPVLPFNALDVALEVQKSLEGCKLSIIATPLTETLIVYLPELSNN